MSFFKYTGGKGYSMDYRIIATISIIAAALLMIGIFYTIKTRSKKNYLAILALAGIAVIAVWTIKLQSVDEYYQANTKDEVKLQTNTVSLSIRCDTVVGKKSEYKIKIPADGIILDKKDIPIKKGDTVLNILIRATKENKIPFDYEGSEDSTAYIRGINDLYEMDFGEQSGWQYKINGKFPGIDCGEYEVADKDEIEWVYTCNLGKDVGRE